LGMVPSGTPHFLDISLPTEITETASSKKAANP